MIKVSFENSFYTESQELHHLLHHVQYCSTRSEGLGLTVWGSPQLF